MYFACVRACTLRVCVRVCVCVCVCVCVSAIHRQLVESSVVHLTCFALPQSAGNKLITRHAYTYMGIHVPVTHTLIFLIYFNAQYLRDLQCLTSYV